MSLLTYIDGPLGAVRVTIQIAMWVYESEQTHAGLKETARRLTTDLNVIGGVLEQLKHYARRITVSDEGFLIRNMTELDTLLNEAQNLLKKIGRDRNFIQRLLMKKGEYEQKLQAIIKQLHDICAVTQRTIPTITKIQIPHREFSDFRRTFKNMAEKELSFYDFSIVDDTLSKCVKSTFGTFDATSSLCYIKQSNERFFLSYQLRTWSALDLTLLVLAQRRKQFARNWLNRSADNTSDSNSSLDTFSSTRSLPTVTAANHTHEKLDFSEFFMVPDYICGMTFTKSCIYIAIKYEITVISSSKQKIIAQHGMEGDGPKTFRHISYIYIPPNDENNLYIVDRGQFAVHHYKIDDSGLRFEYVHRYIVIADVPETSNLISCAILDRNLYVSDDANDCLHVFALNKERQSFYLSGNSITPFSPGSLCADENYLYVANCSVGNIGVVVFNNEYQPVDWFRNPSLKEILAIDIDPVIHELYVLTTATVTESGEQKKQPLIVSMDSIIRSEQS